MASPAEAMKAEVLEKYENALNKYLYVVRFLKLDDIATFKLILSVHTEELIKLTRSEGWTLLHWGAYYNNYEVVKLLIAAGADVKVRNKKGDTAAHLVSGKDGLRCLDLLFTHGINILEKDRDGMNAIDIAKAHKRHDIVEKLQKYIKEKGAVDDGKYCKLTIDQVQDTAPDQRPKTDRNRRKLLFSHHMSSSTCDLSGAGT